LNIFYLDACPVKAAQLQVDTHVNKMITETAQILSNAYTLDHLKLAPKTQKGLPRKHSYPHHPCSKWVQQGMDNFNWLVEHGIALYNEKCYCLGGDHFSFYFIEWCSKNKPDFPQGWTTPALAMKNYPQFMNYTDPVNSYKKFYVSDKQLDNSGKRMDNYTKRNRPDFWFEYFELAQFKDYHND